MKEFYTKSLKGLIFLRDHFEALIALIAIALLVFALYVVVDKANAEPMLETNTTFVEAVKAESNTTILKDINITEQVKKELQSMEANKTVIPEPTTVLVKKQPKKLIKVPKKQPKKHIKVPKKQPKKHIKVPKKDCVDCVASFSKPKSSNSKVIVQDLEAVYNYKNHTTTEDIWSYQNRIQSKYPKGK